MPDTYNGWANYETWNVALWIGNDEGLYNMAREWKGDYKSFAEDLREIGAIETPDKVTYADSGLDTEALDEMMRELG
ncbi:MAG: hypothetical protein E4G89_03055 [Methanothrix sp.]|nr:MAG: hypothetical protein E4G89_03055 [Methanothrix sp.]